MGQKLKALCPVHTGPGNTPIQWGWSDCQGCSMGGYGRDGNVLECVWVRYTFMGTGMGEGGMGRGVYG